MWKRTKIIATIGPASATQAQMEELIQAGVDLFRINFSHGARETHDEELRTIRAAESRSRAADRGVRRSVRSEDSCQSD